MESILNTFIAYFVIVDPIGTSLIFNALTNDKPRSYIKKMALRSVVLSTFLVLVFGFWGIGLLENLGIQMESFKIAGGILIFYAAFGMITKPDENQENIESKEYEDISVFPLTIPLIAGPGCLTMTVIIFSNAKDTGANHLPIVLSILTVYLITFFSFIFSKTIVRIAGKTINNIFKRLLGVLLASLAIQFIAEGIKGLLLQ
ncbi:MAG: MarC family protein [Desulforegulaceae bacterium]|nr:MarC family protein [Desulforegulaceae bacterium]